ncbi:MAG: tRNA threonylcarbamoyladenosine dehydratase [Clostridiales bacterium]|nr:tRNA threonylcarbamoyladenosine dehydratase [Clostridiales bacterium]
MLNQFSRTELLIGKEGMERLSRARVAVFGIGGVGGFAVEALARSGIGSFVLVDSDRVCLSNLNRQIIATRSTIGQYKVDAMEERIHDINPEAETETRKCFFLPENADEFDFQSYSYIVDAMDTVTAKLELISRAKKLNIPIISCMGAGNKLDPTQFRVDDIYNTTVCPLARIMRRECRKRGIKELKVVFSTEECVRPIAAIGDDCKSSSDESEKNRRRRDIPGSTAFVPSVAGLIIAGEVVRDLAKGE